MGTLPIIRTTERNDFKRCQYRWYWKWRRGLVPRAKSFGNLDLGSWVHLALAEWYCGPGIKRGPEPVETIQKFALMDIREAEQAGAPEHVIEEAHQLLALGSAMLDSYRQRYGIDEHIFVIQPEHTMRMQVPDRIDPRVALAIYQLTGDLLYRDLTDDQYWLKEHKTAKSIRTEHLSIDEQARTYLAVSEWILRKEGQIPKKGVLKGIMYNYLRKGYPDDREMDKQGYALNKNGTRSKRQPPPLFVRTPRTMTTRARQQQLRRLQRETDIITGVRQDLKWGVKPENLLTKTPHHTCPKMCEFFDMCELQEEGGNYKELQRMQFTVRNPYEDQRGTTDDPYGFEMG